MGFYLSGRTMFKKANLGGMEFVFVAIILFLILIVLVRSTIHTAFFEERDLITECRQDCHKLGNEYFKIHRDGFNQNDCLCITPDGEVINLW